MKIKEQSVDFPKDFDVQKSEVGYYDIIGKHVDVCPRNSKGEKINPEMVNEESVYYTYFQGSKPVYVISTGVKVMVCRRLTFRSPWSFAPFSLVVSLFLYPSCFT